MKAAMGSSVAMRASVPWALDLNILLQRTLLEEFADGGEALPTPPREGLRPPLISRPSCLPGLPSNLPSQGPGKLWLAKRSPING